MIIRKHEKERKDERKKKREEGTQPAAQDWKFKEPAWVCMVLWCRQRQDL